MQLLRYACDSKHGEIVNKITIDWLQNRCIGAIESGCLNFLKIFFIRVTVVKVICMFERGKFFIFNYYSIIFIFLILSCLLRRNAAYLYSL